MIVVWAMKIGLVLLAIGVVIFGIFTINNALSSSPTRYIDASNLNSNRAPIYVEESGCEGYGFGSKNFIREGNKVKLPTVELPVSGNECVFVEIKSGYKKGKSGWLKYQYLKKQKGSQ